MSQNNLNGTRNASTTNKNNNTNLNAQNSVANQSVNSSLTNFNAGNLINDFIPRGSFLYNYNPHISGYVYCFMTTPRLNLSESNLLNLDINNSVISSEILNQLSYGLSESKFKTNSKFIKCITNLIKGFPLDDLALNSIDAFRSQTGFEFSYGGTISNENLQDITLQFNETKDLLITKLMFVWSKYISYAKYGSVVRDPDVAIARILDYTSSLYFFAVEPDGETLTLWGRYTGIFPTSTPLSGLGTESKSTHGINELSVSFKSNFREVFSTSVLKDFVTLTSGNEVVPIGQFPKSSQRNAWASRDMFNQYSSGASPTSNSNSNQTTGGQGSQTTPNSGGNNYSGFQTLDRDNHFVVASTPTIVQESTPSGIRYKLRFLKKG